MKHIRIVAIALVLTVLLASCTRPKDDSDHGTKEENQLIEMSLAGGQAMDRLPYCPAISYTISEPQLKKTTGTTQEVVFYRDGNPIYGTITRPKGQGPFKTIVIASGLYASLGRYAEKAKRYSEYGYAVVEFTFQSNIPPEDYSDPEYIGDFIFDEVEDLYAVIDSLEFISFLDTSNIYLYGHSMGGLVASYVGTYRQRDIRGLILVDPSFYAVDLMEFEHDQTITTDIYPLVSECRIPVVIFTGTAGSFGEDPHFFDEARAAFPDCEYVVIEGATHIFSGAEGDHLVDTSVEIMNKWG